MIDFFAKDLEGKRKVGGVLQYFHLTSRHYFFIFAQNFSGNCWLSIQFRFNVIENKDNFLVWVYFWSINNGHKLAVNV